MVNILSTGTAMNIAVTTGDAGQLGMVAGFDGYFSGLISRLIHPMDGLALGDSDGGDLFKGDALRGDRLWRGLFLGLWRFLTLAGCLNRGDSPLGTPCQRLGWPYPHYFSQH
ncbi:MAG: hypothetical protein KME14_13490 [Tildeniella torsiva UHER 1998/13D]|jgi:hypothetical protein|nr:hypothetical protein [Tildeniella torsiva UHER 1998/13D]